MARVDQAIEIRAFEPRGAAAQEWAGFHAYRRVRAAEDEPGEPIEDDAECEYGAKREWPLYENRRFLACLQGAIAGSLGFSFRREGTQDYAEFADQVHVWGGVRQSCRRRRVGTALLRPLIAFMDQHGKKIAGFGTHLPEGRAFLDAIGAVERLRGVENRLEFAGLDWEMLARWEADAIPPGSKLRWEVHHGRVPMPRLAELAPAYASLLGDVPTGTLDQPPMRMELPAMASWYEAMDRHGGAHLLVLLMDGQDVAGISEAGWDARFPDRVYQQLTGIARPWRGQGLARGLKAAMLRLVRERHPAVTMMTTFNADTNAAMLSINQRLGFRRHRSDSSYQIRREVLSAWMARAEEDR